MAGFASTILIVLAQTLNHSEPHWKLDLSLAGTNITLNSSQIGTNSLMNCSNIGTNPGISKPEPEPEPEPIVRLEYEPTPDNYSDENNLIRFQPGARNKRSWKPWVDRLQTILEPYEEGSQFAQNIKQCDSTSPAHAGMICYFDIRKLGMNCTKERNFGYDKGQPCILIKMNRVFNWVPVPYDDTSLLDEMPEDLKQGIHEYGVYTPFVGLSCKGKSQADRDNMGPFVYTPIQGFPTYYFPDKNISNYLTPFVMVQFLKPEPGALINIECKAWAQNIVHNEMEGSGIVHFQLLVE